MQEKNYSKREDRQSDKVWWWSKKLQFSGRFPINVEKLQFVPLVYDNGNANVCKKL